MPRVCVVCLLMSYFVHLLGISPIKWSSRTLVVSGCCSGQFNYFLHTSLLSGPRARAHVRETLAKIFIFGSFLDTRAIRNYLWNILGNCDVLSTKENQMELATNRRTFPAFLLGEFLHINTSCEIEKKPITWSYMHLKCVCVASKWKWQSKNKYRQ